MLSIGQVIAANTPDLIDEGFDRALDAAEAIGRLVEKPVVITAAVEERAEDAAAEAVERQAEGSVPSEAEGPVGEAAEGSPRA